MSSAKKNTSPFDTVKFRLTVFSGAVIALTILAAFVALYGYLGRALQSNVDGSLTTELAEFASIYENGGLDALRQEVTLEEVAHGKDRIFIRVFDEAGQEIAATEWPHMEAMADFKSLKELSERGAIDSLHTPDGTRSFRRIFGSVGPGVYAVLGVNNDDSNEVMATFRQRCIEVFSLSLVACVVGAWIISRRAMRGVEMLTASATRIDKGTLSMTIPAPGVGREIDELARVLNEMLLRITVLVSESKSLNDNIAHELRSPLMRIRCTAENILDSASGSTNSADMAASIIEECDSLLAVINSMLAISEMEAGIAAFSRAPLDCSMLAREMVELFQPAAEDRDIQLDVVANGACVVSGDSARLKRVVANILDNAIKYTPPNGRVTMTVRRDDAEVVLTVDDTGVGIGERDLPHVYDRFYRADQSRSLPGNGLGLGLAKAIIHAHGGEISLRSKLGEGTSCTVRIPIAGN